jgi:hypothetical protein
MADDDNSATASLPAPPPVFASWADYLARTPMPQRMRWCAAIAKRANQKRLLSATPKVLVTERDVWNIMKDARGRCQYCGSLAVESRPSKPNGAPAHWAHIGRRIGSINHRKPRIHGGDNNLANLDWACLWCNTWPEERVPRAPDHGGIYPRASVVLECERNYPTGSALPLAVVYALYQQGFRFDVNDDEDNIVAALEKKGIPDARRALRAYLQEPSEIDTIAEIEKMAAELGIRAGWLFYRR